MKTEELRLVTPEDGKGQGVYWKFIALALGAAQLFVGLLSLILR